MWVLALIGLDPYYLEIGKTIKINIMKTLSLNQMALVQGGDVIDIIDGACALGGVAAVLGGPIAPGILAFCAGWALGHWIFN